MFSILNLALIKITTERAIPIASASSVFRNKSKGIVRKTPYITIQMSVI